MLPVHKFKGMISKDVSRWLTKRLGKVKLGHVGTLDPGASGVLPLLFGSATRLQDYLLNLPKTYDFDMEFGYETDSLDSDGEEVNRSSVSEIATDALHSVISDFERVVTQTPPIYSAVKYNGRPLYDYARSGQADKVPLNDLARDVTIHSCRLIGSRATAGITTATVRAKCSKGTYIRVLARDIAYQLGSLATVTRLERREAAGVHLSKTVTLAEIEKQIAEGPQAIESLLTPISEFNLPLLKCQLMDTSILAKLQVGQEVYVARTSLVSDEGRDATEPRSGSELLLLDQCSNAFGIGIVRQTTHDGMVIKMRRGL